MKNPRFYEKLSFFFVTNMKLIMTNLNLELDRIPDISLDPKTNKILTKSWMGLLKKFKSCESVTK
jgi:hypothetical protein